MCNSIKMYNYVFYILQDRKVNMTALCYKSLFDENDKVNTLIVSDIELAGNIAAKVRSKNNYIVCSLDLAYRLDFKLLQQLENFAGFICQFYVQDKELLAWASAQSEILFLTNNLKELKRAILWIASGCGFTPTGEPFSLFASNIKKSNNSSNHIDTLNKVKGSIENVKNLFEDQQYKDKKYDYTTDFMLSDYKDYLFGDNDCSLLDCAKNIKYLNNEGIEFDRQSNLSDTPKLSLKNFSKVSSIYSLNDWMADINNDITKHNNNTDNDNLYVKIPRSSTDTTTTFFDTTTKHNKTDDTMIEMVEVDNLLEFMRMFSKIT